MNFAALDLGYRALQLFCAHAGDSLALHELGPFTLV
jgi:hypothetical protein